MAADVDAGFVSSRVGAIDLVVLAALYPDAVHRVSAELEIIDIRARSFEQEDAHHVHTGEDVVVDRVLNPALRGRTSRP